MTVRALPRSLEDLRGRRAARWIRESTAGQADNFGPDAQAEQQTRAIQPWGLVDTGGAREAGEAEAYSRRRAKRIREGYAAKRRRLRVPGGNRAPFGTIRDGRTITVDEASLSIVRRAYELPAAAPTARELAAP